MKDKIIKYCDKATFFSLCALVFFLPFTKAALQVFSWLAIFTWIIKKAASHKDNTTSYLPKTEINKYIYMFFLICAISIPLSIDTALSLKALFSKVLKQIILYFVIVETVNNKERFRNILLIIIASAVLILTDSLVQHFIGMDFLRGYTKAGIRIQASFSNPNGLGGWLIVILSILIFSAKELIHNKYRKISLFSILLLCLLLILCLILTYSRASWLSFAISLAMAICYLFIVYKKEFKNTFIIVFFLTMLFIFVLPPIIKTNIYDNLKRNGSITIRMNLWKEASHIIEDFSLLGAGLNTYSKIVPYYIENKNNGGTYPHNSYLQMAAEIGILGLMSFAWMIIKLFIYGLGLLRKNNDYILLGFLTAIGAFLIHSSLDVGLYALQLVTLFWILVGLTMARISILKNNVI